MPSKRAAAKLTRIFLGCIYLVITLGIPVAYRIRLPEFHSKWPFLVDAVKKGGKFDK
jgi:hypothetical protein